MATALGLRELDVEAAADAIMAGRTRQIDLARVTRNDGTTAYFGTVLASGFDSRVNDRANAMRWPRGGSRYNIAILIEFLTLTESRTRSTWSWRTARPSSIIGDLVMATVGNGAQLRRRHPDLSGRRPGGRTARCRRSCARRAACDCCDCSPASTRARTRRSRRSRPIGCVRAACFARSDRVRRRGPDRTCFRSRSMLLRLPSASSRRGTPRGRTARPGQWVACTARSLASTWSRSSSGAASLHARATHLGQRARDERLVLAAGAVLEVLGDIGLRRLADLVPEVLLEVAPGLLTAAVGHFLLPWRPRRCRALPRNRPAVHEASACHDAGGS